MTNTKKVNPAVSGYRVILNYINARLTASLGLMLNATMHYFLQSCRGPFVLVEQELTDRLLAEFEPIFLSVINESHRHSVPPNSETHFKVVVVSDKYAGMPLVKRHQSVYGLLPDLLQSPVHALSMRLFTEDEWRKEPTVKDSPDCLGGS